MSLVRWVVRLREWVGGGFGRFGDGQGGMIEGARV